MIKFLQLKNFKCFSDIMVDFSNLTVITGVNGMGKSSIIQSLLLLRQSFDERYLQVDQVVQLNAELINLQNGDALRYSWADDKEIDIIIGFENDIESSFTIDSASQESKLNVNVNGSDWKTNLFNSNFAYLYAERLAPQATYLKNRDMRSKSRLGSKNGDLAASLLFSLAEKGEKLPIPALKHPDAEDDFVHKNVSEWISDIVYAGVQLRAEEETANSIKLSYVVERGSKKGNATYSPLAVAFGFSYVLPVILGVLTAQPGSLLIIENPEAHLHPSAQTKMGKLLALAAQNGVQIIIETHSDHLVNGIRLMVKGLPKLQKLDTDKVLLHYFNSFVVDDLDDRYADTLKIFDDGKLDGWPTGFFDEWEKSLISLVD